MSLSVNQTFKKMSPEKAQEWIDNLKGKYWDKKGRGYLCVGAGEMCCLGVLADMHDELEGIGRKAINGSYRIPPEHFFFKHGISRIVGSNIGGNLMNLNDQSETFQPVIDLIQKTFIDEA